MAIRRTEVEDRVVAREGAREFFIRGVVQGVGFRPFVHRLALRHGLNGWVRNEAGSVTVRVRGRGEALDSFKDQLTAEAPPLALIQEVAVREISPGAWSDFRVLPSELEGEGCLPVSPDAAICPSCQAELHDPGNRRFHYPFVTCTDCGPRFTVIREMPYDRERTAMEAFPQCPDCMSEYGDPRDRRYHSESNSCAHCGPRIWFEGRAEEDGETAEGERALERSVALIRKGGILALRGLGGFHLAVDATDDAAVRRLRERKGREAKPLAIMVSGLAQAREVAEVGVAEAALLASVERPIVLLERREGAGLSPALAPGLHTLGVMIPYSPLHDLLLASVGRPLVMTSGNLSEEPLAASNQEARNRLARMADGFLLHDREIENRMDDSVVRVVEGEALFLRRARGYAPLPLPLPVATPVPLLAVGPHLKNTFTLASGSTAYPSQHIGDLEKLETLDHFTHALSRYSALFRIRPERVVRDLHPGYLSTRLAGELAESWGCGEPMAVQHHHAHVAAVLAEHGETGPAVGVSYDGTGYGTDGRIWGAEVLEVDLISFRRRAHLRYAPLPGGEAAVRNPWRTAVGYLSLEPELEADFSLAFQGVSQTERGVVGDLARRGVNAPLASSMGRLFDGALAVLGHRARSRFEGQGGMEMEGLAAGAMRALDPGCPLPFPWSGASTGPIVMDPLPLLSALGRARRKGEGTGSLALSFHQALMRTTVEVVQAVCGETGLKTVVLSGGVFQNAILLEGIAGLLERAGFRVLVPRRLSPNDGAISFGQAAVAAACLSHGLESPMAYPEGTEPMPPPVFESQAKER